MYRRVCVGEYLASTCLRCSKRGAHSTLTLRAGSTLRCVNTELCVVFYAAILRCVSTQLCVASSTELLHSMLRRFSTELCIASYTMPGVAPQYSASDDSILVRTYPRSPFMLAWREGAQRESDCAVRNQRQ
eukprot:3683424-Rhodomonas_salina.1